MTKTYGLAMVLGGALLMLPACGDDDGDGNGNGGGVADASIADATVDQPDSAPEADAAPVDPMVARGRYLVENVLVCTECHTPRNPNGTLDTGRWLAGTECLIDLDPADPNAGCLNSGNLTNHDTGLATYTDEEIKDMFLNGVRPNGEALIDVMPYYQTHNITADDADAVVAFLRTVKGVDNTVPEDQAPWAPPAAPHAPIDITTVPEPVDDQDPDYESAVRGRYIAAVICLGCHTPKAPDYPVDTTSYFIGGQPFPLFSPVFTEDIVYSSNVTPDPTTGIGDWTIAQIIAAVKQGTEPDGNKICPPMPAGPMGGFGGMTTEDATDVANYLKSIAPRENQVPGGECTLAF